MVSPPDDDLSQIAALIARSRAGESQAFLDLLERFRPWLAGFLAARTDAAQRSTEAGASTFASVVRAAKEQLPAAEVRNVGEFWLYLRQIALEQLTRRHREPEGQAGRPVARSEGTSAEKFSSLPSTAQQGDVLLTAEEQEQFEAALQHVPPRERQAVVLRLELKYRYEAIARDAGYPTREAARDAICDALSRVATEIAEFDDAQ